MNYAFFLGRQPEFSATEVWHRLQMHGLSFSLVLASDRILVLDVSSPLPDGLIDELGGIDRIAEVVSEGSIRGQWDAKRVMDFLPSEKRKFSLGLSVLGDLDLPLKRLGTDVKKLVKESGRNMKFVVPAGGTQLNAAQVMFNKLDVSPNLELTWFVHEDRVYLLKTLSVQDVQAYEKRDMGRVVRDAKVGMLPPKLAQMMLTFGLSGLSSEEALAVLDPFCGLGTVLQEGWLMDYQMVGSDASARMVDASDKNLYGLTQHFTMDDNLTPELLQHDVRQPFPPHWVGTFDAVVTEPYLGRPQSSTLSPSEASEYALELSQMYIKAFEHFSPILKPGGHVVFLLPAFRATSGFTTFPDSLLDDIERLGYRMKHLVPEELAALYPPTARKTLLYARPDAYVGREVTAWEKVD